MTKIEVTKQIVSLVVGAGTTKIIAGIIARNTEPTKLTQKVSIVAAGVVLGSMAADATSSYTDAKIDEIVDWWNNRVKKAWKQES
jgi:heme O synthase-like polyprenyltransferase